MHTPNDSCDQSCADEIGAEERQRQCKMVGCEGVRELYADGSRDTLGDYCVFHGETEEGHNEVKKEKTIEDIVAEKRVEYNRMWDEGKFNWNRDPKGKINPARIFEVFIAPIITFLAEYQEDEKFCCKNQTTKVKDFCDNCLHDLL